MKIFDISFPRCGTTSTSTFLADLGFKPCESDPQLTKSLFEDKLDWSNVDTNDAFGDIPFALPRVYVAAKYRYPDSKFILHTRPVEDWLRSIEGLLNIVPYPDYLVENRKEEFLLNTELYGYFKFHRVIFSQIFLSRIQTALTVFSSCLERLLVIDLYSDRNADQIMDFVGVRKNSIFPHHNKQMLGKVKLYD